MEVSLHEFLGLLNLRSFFSFFFCFSLIFVENAKDGKAMSSERKKEVRKWERREGIDMEMRGLREGRCGGTKKWRERREWREGGRDDRPVFPLHL